ncbi:hypothetical protein G9A89_016522 [Geosiphon pyriformis]|nr:hypothetical protein G9A89_016522 [Geosiphon pyriformis]
MAYAPIAKIEKFTTEKAIAANRWNDARAILTNKLQDYNAFKLAFLQYFNNNNRENEAVTTYLGCFHRNLCQIQAIQTDYFTVPQILNQFIRGLHSSILQHIHPMHPTDLQAAVTNAKDFEAAELEANHVQAVNLMMNGSSELDSKLKQFKSVVHIIFDQSAVTAGDACLPLLCTISTDLPANNTTANILTTHILTSSLSTTATSNVSTTATTNNLLGTCSSNTTIQPSSNNIRKPQIQSNPKLKIGDSGSPTNSQFIKLTIRIMPVEFKNRNYLSLLVSPEDAAPSTQKINQRTLTNNILLTTIFHNKLLAAIFPFELKEPLVTPLFSGAAFEEKPITAMYMDAKVDGQSIKLILDSGLAGSIITKQLIDQLADRATKTPISKIENLLIEINGIITPIKALIGNDWLSKTNTVLDWMTQKLALSQNGQHIWVPATCGHFKMTNPTTPLIEFEEEKKKPTWEAYQVSWADKDHNELLPIIS